MLNLTVEIGSNPDRDRADWKETHVISARTMADLRVKIEAFQSENDLGGGNWGEAELREDGIVVGYVSYNGRLWKDKYWEAK